MHLNLLVLSGLLFCICNAVPVVDDDTDTNKSKMKFGLGDILEQVTKSDTPRKSKPKTFTIVGFSWNNCGSSADAIQVQSLSLSPDPITIPGKEKAAFDITFATNVIKPTRLEIVIQKEIFGMFIKIPCIDNIGSCTYSDPCAMLANLTCPPVLIKNNIPCHCPFNAGKYTLPSSIINLPKINLPSIVENGEYKLQGTLYNGNTRLACYNVDASLNA